MISNTPKPPYYAVIFTSLQKNDDGYELMGQKMEELAQKQKGYLGIESTRDENGFGITVSYWQDLESVSNWKKNTEHLEAQKLGKNKWYQDFKVRISKVERDYHL